MKLFEKMKVGNLEVQNRIMFPPMVTYRGSLSNFVTRNCKNFYVELAKGGAGIVVIEMTFINHTSPLFLGLYDDEHISDYKEMINKMHKDSNAKIFIQLGDALPGSCKVDEISENMIEVFYHNFKSAAVRAKKTGADGIELNGAQGYMLSAFLSLTNNRKDKYGGSLSKRMYLIKRILRGVQEVCGKDYPIGVRIDADEFIVGGSSLKHTARIAKELAKQKVAYISLAVGGEMQNTWYPPAYMPDGVNVYLAEEIKKTISKYKTPIVTAGKIPNAHLAESILQNNEADIIGIGRAILCDNEWPIKSKENRFDEISKCLYCNQCMDYPSLQKPITCIRWNNNKKT